MRAAPVAAARRLHRRPERAATGRFLVDGVRVVGEALRDPRALVEELFLTPAALAAHPELAAGGAGVAVRPVSEEVMRALAPTRHPQGVLAVCRACDVPLAEALSPPPRLVAVLCDVADPGNAGTLVRSADACGAGAVVFAGTSVDPYNPKVVRASAGSLFHLAVCAGDAVEPTVAALAGAGLQLLAADAHAAEPVDELGRSGELAAPTAWLFGNEAHGLPDAAVAAARRVRVPMFGAAESLNLAAAAAVLLFASARAQHGGAGEVQAGVPPGPRG